MNVFLLQLVSLIHFILKVNSFTDLGFSTIRKSLINFKMAGGGGQGWRNDDFLSSLGGNEEDREEMSKNYEAYKTSRESFEKRQLERMKSPEYQKFQQTMSENLQNQRIRPMDDDGDFFNDMNTLRRADESRFQTMMRQAQRNVRMGSNPLLGYDRLGFEQQLGVPLDDSDDAEQVD